MIDMMKCSLCNNVAIRKKGGWRRKYCDSCARKVINNSQRIKQKNKYKNDLVYRKKHISITIWAGMKSRCSNSNDTRYKWYGNRGIKVCERWKKWKNFLKDMGKRPDGYSIERINNDGNYEPSNCKWIPKNENRSREKRKDIYVFPKRLIIGYLNRYNKIVINLNNMMIFKNATDTARYYGITRERIRQFLNNLRVGKKLKNKIIYYRNLYGKTT